MKSDKRREALFILYLNSCAYCREPFSNNDKKEVHHGGRHDTKGNNKNYPLFTQSLMNKFPMHFGCHKDHPGFGRIPEGHAELYENFLQAFQTLLKEGVEVNMRLLIKELEIMFDEACNI